MRYSGILFLELSLLTRISEDSDSPATGALFRVAIEAEVARDDATQDLSWHATVNEMLSPKLFHDSKSGFTSSKSKGYVHGRHPRKPRESVKTIPPPKVASVTCSSLSQRIDSLQKHSLVGKWYFPEMNEESMRKWITGSWSPLIGYTLIISRLMKDWLSFHFQKASDLELILNRPWVYGRSFLSLSRWFMGFDPLKNTPKNTPSHSMIWVKLPNLPLELWTTETLTMIGDAVGKFIYVDPWVRGEKDKRIAWILIERPYKGGYPDQIEILWEGLKICQRLDFWGIPFRCSFCHRTGHLIRNCRHRSKHRTNRHPSKKKRSSGPDSEDVNDSENLFSSQSTDLRCS